MTSFNIVTTRSELTINIKQKQMEMLYVDGYFCRFYSAYITYTIYFSSSLAKNSSKIRLIY